MTEMDDLLSPFEVSVLTIRFVPTNLGDVAEMFYLTPKEIRLIEAKALKTLTNNGFNINEIADYYKSKNNWKDSVE